MALADCNKEKLGDAGVIPLLIRSLQEVKIKDLSADLPQLPKHFNEALIQENATAALLALAFTDENLEKLREQSDELEDLLIGLTERSCEHESDARRSAMDIASMRRAKVDAGYLFWLLNLSEDDDDDHSDSDNTHVMVSYHACDKLIAEQVPPPHASLCTMCGCPPVAASL